MMLYTMKMQPKFMSLITAVSLIFPQVDSFIQLILPIVSVYTTLVYQIWFLLHKLIIFLGRSKSNLQKDSCLLILIVYMMNQQLLPIKKKQQSYSKYSTNQVLLQEQSDRTIYYLPCFVRFMVRQILEIDIQKMQANVSGTLLFSFYYGNMPKHILKQLIKEDKCLLHLQVTAQSPIPLNKENGISIKKDKKQNMIHFRIKKQFTCILKSEVAYSPFEILNLHLTVIVQKVTLDPEEQAKNEDFDQKSVKPIKKIHPDLDQRPARKCKTDIKFNCMDAEDVVTVITDKKISFKDYNIAKYFLQAKYHNSDAYLFQKISVIKPQSNEYPVENFSRIHQFRYANFRITLYKQPGASLIQIFVPLWILGFITLLIFFQQFSLSGRISIIATLTLAFIAFIPVINTQIPKSPDIKLVQILIYMQTITTILCLIDSLLIYMTQDITTYVWTWKQDKIFLVSLTINIFNIFAVFGLFGLHKLYWQKRYLSSQNKSQTGDNINRKKWSHLDCDDHFMKYFNNKKVRAI